MFFPEQQRREETGKAVMPPEPDGGLPVRCELPLPGEDLSYVLYGSGGCSLIDSAKAWALGGFDEVYKPAYVEDLDLGVRAWQLGWPIVFVADAAVTHDHRTTTSRYYSQEELDRVLEINYLRFLVRTIQSPKLFWKLWDEAVTRLTRNASSAALSALAETRYTPSWVNGRLEKCMDEEMLLALTSGSVAVFPGAFRNTPSRSRLGWNV